MILISVDNLDTEFYAKHHPELFSDIENRVLIKDLSDFFSEHYPEFDKDGEQLSFDKCDNCIRGITTPECHHDYGWDQAEWYCPVEDDCRWELDGHSFYPSKFDDGDNY